MLHAVILSGGSGTRFWPMSRTARPKQLLPLLDGRSLLTETIDRLDGLVPPERVLIVTNRAQEAETRRQAPSLPPENILIEPFGRDTAPCIGLAAAILEQRCPGATMAVLPADHRITPAEAFRDVLARAAEAAGPGRVITLGATPNRPATGFGYIEAGDADPDHAGLRLVRSFKEKPDLATAERYIASPDYLWNCGIFVWRATTVLDQLAAHKPELHAGLTRIAEAAASGPEARFRDVLGREYEAFEKISIDYAVLEHCDAIGVFAIDFAWDDLGSWTAVERLHEPDEQGLRVVQADLASIESRNCFVHGDGRAIALIGVEDLVVVQTEDATLICHRDKVEKVKGIVSELATRGRGDLL